MNIMELEEVEVVIQGGGVEVTLNTTMYELLRALSECSTGRVWKGASMRVNLCLGMQMGIDSRVAKMEAMRMETQGEHCSHERGNSSESSQDLSLQYH